MKQNKRGTVSRKQKPHKKLSNATDWEVASDWYDKLVGDEGSYYHKHVIVPNLISFLTSKAGDSLLDLACGQGVLCRELASRGYNMTGIDLSESLLKKAKERSLHSPHKINYLKMDVRNLKKSTHRFDAILSVLAIQNIDPLAPVVSGVANVLKKGGELIWILNHPAFRVPRKSSWGYDESASIQFRRIDHYMSHLKVPIQMHPGSDPSTVTWSFHRPIQFYIKTLVNAGFAITDMEEWCSQKVSGPGPRKKAEDRSRKEIPLFLAIKAIKSE